MAQLGIAASFIFVSKNSKVHVERAGGTCSWTDSLKSLCNYFTTDRTQEVSEVFLQSNYCQNVLNGLHMYSREMTYMCTVTLFLYV